LVRLILPYAISQLEKSIAILNGEPATCQELLVFSKI